jgi:hypothetical protein
VPEAPITAVLVVALSLAMTVCRSIMVHENASQVFPNSKSVFFAYCVFLERRRVDFASRIREAFDQGSKCTSALVDS